MRIVEESDTRLVLRQQRRGMSVALGIFTILSAFLVFNLIVQGLQRFDAMNLLEVYNWLIFILLSALIAAFGALVWARIGRGTQCIFDREQETVTIEQARLFGRRQRVETIFAISHLELTRNDEVRVIGLFLVLRSSERIALATLPHFDEDHAENLARHVRAFLRG